FFVASIVNVNLGAPRGAVHSLPFTTTFKSLTSSTFLPPTSMETTIHSPWSLSLSSFFSSPAQVAPASRIADSTTTHRAVMSDSFKARDGLEPASRSPGPSGPSCRETLPPALQDLADPVRPRAQRVPAGEGRVGQPFKDE